MVLEATQIGTEEHSVVLYDGDCGFCSRSVRWIISRDERGVFLFAPLGSGPALELLERWGVKSESLPDSMVLVDKAGVHTRSNAALRIVQRLGFPWRGLGLLCIIPRGLRDKVYDAIARRRKKLGPSVCWVPTPAQQSRFLGHPHGVRKNMQGNG